MNLMHTEVDLNVVVRQTIEEITGNLYKDIRPDSDLIEDLGTTRTELVKIITSVQNKLEISLSEQAKREILEDAQDVSDLVTIIEEEYEF